MEFIRKMLELKNIGLKDLFAQAIVQCIRVQL